MSPESTLCNVPGPDSLSCGRYRGHLGIHFDNGHVQMWHEPFEGPKLPKLPKLPKPAIAHEDLSAREIEVLQHMAEGMTTKESARELFLSPNTVKAHRARISVRLGTENGTHAVAWGFRNGVLV